MALTRGIVAGQARAADERASHNLPVAGSSPARPTCSFNKRVRLLRQMVLRSSGSCEATAYGHEYCEGTAAGAVAKRRQRMFYLSVAADAATTWADAIRCNRRHRRYEQVRGKRCRERGTDGFDDHPFPLCPVTGCTVQEMARVRFSRANI